MKACINPFQYSEITEVNQALCCPAWLKNEVKDVMITSNYKDNFYSNKANMLRQSILDGSYRFCKSHMCPHLSAHKKGMFSNMFVDSNHEDFKNPVLKRVSFGFDRSCNLGCPSCRSNFINFTGKKREQMDNILDNVVEQLGDELRAINICGGGEPFYSKTFMRFMKEFDSSKFPKLKEIRLHTNGILWSEKSWNAIKPIHDYVKRCEISIDAGTKEVYRDVRVGGDWDTLMDNIDFILTIDGLKEITYSFVVQQRNYKDMENFYNLINTKMYGSTKKYRILYYAVSEWGEFKEKKSFSQHEIYNPNHIEHQAFLKELKKIYTRKRVEHPFDYLIVKDSLI